MIVLKASSTLRIFTARSKRKLVHPYHGNMKKKSLYQLRNQGSMIANVQDAGVLTRTIEAANVPKEADPIWTRSEGRFFFSNCRFATAQDVPGIS
jgi:hypothetical protein